MGCWNIDLVNSTSSSKKTSGGRGSDVGVNAATPEMLMLTAGDEATGFGQESTQSKGDPSAAKETERKAGESKACWDASNGVHWIDGGVCLRGEREDNNSSFCCDSRYGSRVPLVARYITSFLVSWAVEPVVASRDAWMWRMEVVDIGVDRNELMYEALQLSAEQRVKRKAKTCFLQS